MVTKEKLHVPTKPLLIDISLQPQQLLTFIEHVEKGEKRCFYLKPNTPFLDEPRKQNQYRHEFIRQIGQAPQPEPLTFLADDLQKVSSSVLDEF